MKRIILIIAASLVFVATITIQKDPNNQQFECINQEHQLVINSYSGETLKFSQSFQDDRILRWRQGFKSPYAEKVTHVAFDITPLSPEDESLLRVYTSKADGKRHIAFWDIISKDCYDVIYATRSKRAVVS